MHEGVNGYLAEPDDIHLLSQAMVILLQQPVKAKAMGQASHLLTEGHNIQITIDKFEQLYTKLVSQQAIQHKPENFNFYQWQKRIKEWLNF